MIVCVPAGKQAHHTMSPSAVASLQLALALLQNKHSSPEVQAISSQSLAAALQPALDIWALGATLWELLHLGFPYIYPVDFGAPGVGAACGMKPLGNVAGVDAATARDICYLSTVVQLDPAIAFMLDTSQVLLQCSEECRVSLTASTPGVVDY